MFCLFEKFQNLNTDFATTWGPWGILKHIERYFFTIMRREIFSLMIFVDRIAEVNHISLIIFLNFNKYVK